MNREQQRMALAEWMPPNLVHYQDGKPLLHVYGDHFVEFKPDKDLNAMHAAEKKIYGTSTWDAYYRWLICCLDEALDSDLGEGSQNYIHATAKQRCEAICRTLWPERWNEKEIEF